MFKRRIILFLTTLLLCVMSFAQAPDDVVTWTISQSEDGTELIFTGKILDGWHIYSLNQETTPTYIEFEDGDYEIDGLPYEITAPQDLNGEKVFFNEAKFGQRISLEEASAMVKGVLTYQACNDMMCTPPLDWDFSIAAKGTQAGEQAQIKAGTTEESAKAGGSLWALIIEAILWGFAMLLTPCVFPMIPMTISFFMKGSSTPAQGRFKAFMYGLFIVLLYTVPISLIILITRIVGGDAVTADIFNWLSTHWLPNIIFFIVFMVFAASFFGAFEIVLPSKLVNKSDKNSEKAGLTGIFFLALTLVLVSFSCTGPIVGSVLIKSTQGEFLDSYGHNAGIFCCFRIAFYHFRPIPFSA